MPQDEVEAMVERDILLHKIASEVLKVGGTSWRATLAAERILALLPEALTHPDEATSTQEVEPVSFAWTAANGRPYPPYVNLTGNRIRVRGEPSQGEVMPFTMGWIEGPYVSVELPDEAIESLREALSRRSADNEVTEDMMMAGYDATRLPDGTPQFADAGFCVGHTAAIYQAMRRAALATVCASCGRSKGKHPHYPNICDGFRAEGDWWTGAEDCDGNPVFTGKLTDRFVEPLKFARYYIAEALEVQENSDLRDALVTLDWLIDGDEA